MTIARARDAAAAVASRPAVERVVGMLDRLAPHPANFLGILTYHRVAPLEWAPDRYPGLIGATPQEFRRQMEAVAATYRILPMEDVLRARHEGTPLPPRAVVVTFDDGYDDFEEFAWPVLRSLGIPATVFVPTAFPDAPGRAFWWDRLYDALRRTDRRALRTSAGTLPLGTSAERTAAYRLLRAEVQRRPHPEAMDLVERAVAWLGGGSSRTSVLGWDALRRLAAQGVGVAPHTRTHAMLNRIPLDDVAGEVRGSMDDLNRHVGSCLRVFAYPGGGYTKRVVAEVARAGVEVAFTTLRGGNALDRADWLRLRRINVGRRSSVPLIRAQLHPWIQRVWRSA